MSRAQVKQEREQAGLAMLLAWVAGGVDAIGYIALLHLFTAHMSGNSAALGAFIGEGDWKSAFKRAFPIPLFILGVMFGAVLGEWAVRRKVRSIFSIILTLEAMLLVAFMLYGSRVEHEARDFTAAPWTFYVTVAMLPIAMGLQNATLRKVGNFKVRTTYITGMLTNFAEACVSYGYWLRDHMSGKPYYRRLKILRASTRQPSAQQALICAGIYMGYLTGAFLCAFLMTRWNLRAVCLPLMGLALMIAIDLIRPVYTPSEESGAS